MAAFELVQVVNQRGWLRQMGALDQNWLLRIAYPAGQSIRRKTRLDAALGGAHELEHELNRSWFG